MDKVIGSVKSVSSRTITLSNLSGIDVSEALPKVLNHLPNGSRKIIVEFPCLGMPRVAHAMLDVKKIHMAIERKEKSETFKPRSIDRFILDYDKDGDVNVSNYIIQDDGVDYLVIDPSKMPENTVTQMLDSNETLINLPRFLKTKLMKTYDYIIFVTQGTLIHPTTHFAIRLADAVVLVSNTYADLVGNAMNFRRLNESFGVTKDQMFLFSADPHVQFEDETIYKKYPSLMKAVTGVPQRDSNLVPYVRLKDTSVNTSRDKENKQSENVGIIEPLHYLHNNFSISELENDMSKTDGDNLVKITAHVRKVLQEQYLDDYVSSMRDAVTQRKIRNVIASLVRGMYDKYPDLSMSIDKVILWVQTEITELGVIQEIMEDPTISSIEINGPNEIIVERDGVDLHLNNLKFQSADHYKQLINKITEPMGKTLTGNDPILDLNYKGFRVSVVADKSKAGLSANFPLVSIRKFAPNVYSHEACVIYGNTSWEIIEFQEFITQFANIIFAGGTNSGKTTGLLRQPLFVPPITRIITIEDSEELMYASKIEYQHYPNLPSLLVKDITGNAEQTYGIDRLVKATLRLRPTVLVVGEIRDKLAAKETLIAMNTGHRLWTTIHSNSAKDTATRYLQLCGNDEATRHQVARSIDFIFYQRKLRNGKRVIVEVSELMDFTETGIPVINPIFKYNFVTGRHDRVGSISSEKMMEKMEEYDMPVEDIKKWTEPVINQAATA